MPWEERTVKDQRQEFVQAALDCRNFSALCREYGISRKTGYKWVKRCQEGEEPDDRSRKPHSSPGRTPADVEQAILAVRAKNPGWGARRIHCVLERCGCEHLPCVKTVNNILNRNGCISEEESLKRVPYTRFERAQCNELWQTDFKGEFKNCDGRYCYPLDILDDHSRFGIRVKPFASTENVVIPTFIDAFREFGLPRAVLSDNGSQFAGFRKGYTRFEKFLMDLDILPIHGRIKHPQTQGKIERFHRSMKSELLKHTSFTNLEDADRQFQEWLHKYNYERPHEALGMRCPGEVYEHSARTYPETIPAYCYGGEFHVVKVNSWGYVRFDRWQVYLSETMVGEHIEFRPSADGEKFFACYRNFKIAEFSTATGQLIQRKIARL